MDRARKVRKILPVSPCDIRGLEAWLEEQANSGLFPVSIGSWAVFTADGVPGTRFRLEPYDRGRTAPTEEQRELYRGAGWSYALNVAPAGCWLFYTADPTAVELYSDHESRGLSLERLERAARRAWQRSLLLGVVLAAASAPFDSKTLRAFGQIDALPILNPVMVIYLESPCCFMIAHFFFQHRLNDQCLELRCVSLVWYALWHNKSPHLLDSIPYCLTNGVQFISPGVFSICLSWSAGRTGTRPAPPRPAGGAFCPPHRHSR